MLWAWDNLNSGSEERKPETEELIVVYNCTLP
jgi:hypothetical protein